MTKKEGGGGEYQVAIVFPYQLRSISQPFGQENSQTLIVISIQSFTIQGPLQKYDIAIIFHFLLYLDDRLPSSACL